MNDLRAAMLKCLAMAKERLDEAPAAGLYLVLVGADEVARYESVTQDYPELLNKVLLWAWVTLRVRNADATPDAFAQAAFAIASRERTASQVPGLGELVDPPQVSGIVPE
jgi:hypothetical protein